MTVIKGSIPNVSEPAVLKLYGRIVGFVNQMMVAKQALGTAKTDKNKDYYESKCAAIDCQIEQIVYELYGLSEEEIKIVEGSEHSGDSK